MTGWKPAWESSAPRCRAQSSSDLTQEQLLSGLPSLPLAFRTPSFLVFRPALWPLLSASLSLYLFYEKHIVSFVFPFLFFFFINFYSCTCGIWRSPGWGSNWSGTCQPTPQLRQHHIQAASAICTAACDNAGSLMH